MILPLLLLSQTPGDPPWNCDDPQAQQEMNYCAGLEFQKADAALNAQWKITAAEMKRRDTEYSDAMHKGRPGHFELLLVGQRAWLKYRDAHCAIEGYAFFGGSMEPLIVSTCKTQMTEQRTDELRDLVEFEG